MSWLDGLQSDLAYGWQTTRRAPGLTAVIVITLALGIGASAATFSLLDRLYLRPPGGLTDPATLRRVWVEHFRTNTGGPDEATR